MNIICVQSLKLPHPKNLIFIKFNTILTQQTSSNLSQAQQLVETDKHDLAVLSCQKSQHCESSDSINI